MPRKAILTRARYEEAHNDIHDMIRRYVTTNWATQIRAQDRDLIERTMNRSAKDHYAVNPRARIEFNRVRGDILRQAFQSRREQEYYFVTMAPRDWLTGLASARRFDLAPLRQNSADFMEEGHYVGTIDAAFYSNIWRPLGKHPVRRIAWHWHALAWDVREEALARAAAQANVKFMRLLGDRPVLHVRKCTLNQALSRINYMNKMPISEYRLIRKKGREVQDLGIFAEVAEEYPPLSSQKKRPLRPGDAIRAWRALGNRTIDDLLIGGGDGINLNFQALNGSRENIISDDRAEIIELERLYR